MCGIICYIGEKDAKSILVEGLKKLEYRGYDSAGFAIRNGTGAIVHHRRVGKVLDFEKSLDGKEIIGNIGIAHTRWATHGEPAEANAHPHRDQKRDVFIVHNGIIENYLHLKERLGKKGVVFSSDTDSEVLAHLISQNFKGDLRGAVRETMNQVEGAFGLAVIHKEVPDQIVVARRGSPLIIGIGKGEHFIASDANAFAEHAQRVIHLEDNELAIIKRGEFEISTVENKRKSIMPTTIEYRPEDDELNGFPHFMLKEIFEQPETIKNVIRGRVREEDGLVKLGRVEPVLDKLIECERIIILACGTSYYAGMVGKHMFEKYTDIDVQVELASEFRTRNLSKLSKTVAIAISQSGETADTLAAVKEAKMKGADLLSIVNVPDSTIARLTKYGIYNYAGKETGVASTKVFVSQVMALFLLAILLGRERKQGLTSNEDVELIKAIKELPEKIKKVLSKANLIQAIAQKYCKYNNWLYLGRKFGHPIALEGALKLKEVSYVHAEGYAAGEMKHGPIALINPDMPTVAIAPKDDVYKKMASNINEVKTRKGPVIVIATEGDEEMRELADEIVEIPETLEELYPILTAVACQLLAYYCAAELPDRDIDKPRNLAKSVTVE